jgi:hypothetical protein
MAMIKVRFKTRVNVVFNENEQACIEESRVRDVAGVVVVQGTDVTDIPKSKKEA